MPARSALRLGFGLAAVFVALTLLVVAGWTQSVDDSWNTMMAGAEVPWLVSVADTFDYVGGYPIALLGVVAGVVALWVGGKRWAALTWAVMTALAQLLSSATKLVVDRSRPLNGLAYEPSSSYPSGHSMVAGAATAIGIAVVAGVIWPSRRRLFLVFGVVYAVLMAASRTYLRVHWLTDAIGGFLFGTAVVLVIYAVAFARRDRGTTTEP